MIHPRRHGAAMNCLFGGRAECRIRHTVVPVVLTDAASMYPTVHTLLGLHELLIAARLKTVDCTRAARNALGQVSLQRVLDPTFWPQLRFLAEVSVEDAILPVRARYDEGDLSYTLGVNRVTGSGLWYAAPDLVGSILLTSRVPRIRRAFMIEGEGIIEDLRPLLLRGHLPVDPRTQDLFRTLPEEREALKTDPTLDADARKWLSQNYKTVGNSGAYGITAQVDRRRLGKHEYTRVAVHGGNESFDHRTQTPEEPGPYCFPPVAALVTAGARLILAVLERLVTDAGGTYLFTDTDSMAVVASQRGGLVACAGGPYQLRGGQEAIRALSWAQVRQIQAVMDRLKPYGDAVPHLLKIEDVNFEGQRQLLLFGYMISAKRYCLFTVEESGRIRIRKRSEHGLGVYLDPSHPPPIEEGPKEEPDPNRGWMADVWRYLVAQALGRRPRPPAWFDRPLVMRRAFTRPEDLAPIRAAQADQPYADQIKPFNFLLAVQVADGGHPKGVDPERCRLVAPFERDPAKWLDLEWVDLHSGTRCRIATRGLPAPDVAIVKTVGGYVRAYHERPEAKSAGPHGEPCGPTTKGLLQRRHVTPRSLMLTGKEANLLEEVEHGDISDWDEVRELYARPGAGLWEQETLPTIRRVPASRIAAATGLPIRTIHRVRNSGRRPSKAVEARLDRFVRACRACQRVGLEASAQENARQPCRGVPSTHRSSDRSRGRPRRSGS